MGAGKIILLYLISLGSFLAIDFFWLGVVARDFYRNNLGEMMRDPVNWPAAFSFYLIFVAGAMLLVILPSLNEGSISKAVIMGFIFGVVAYSTYDLTNLATLQNWPLKMALVDIVWGGALSSAVSLVGFAVGHWAF